MILGGKDIKNKLNGVQILVIGFITLILIGSILLSLPISSANGEFTDYTDALFTSTSAVCVTGLVTLDTGTHWSAIGQVIIMLLIEIGGLGFMSIAVFLWILLGKKITLKERLFVQEAMNTFTIQGLVKMIRYIFVFTFMVQLICAIILATQFVPQYGVIKGSFFSIFHSISGFCNAGFDLFGEFNSVMNYSSNSIVILTLSLLIILGGLGFTVIIELYNYRKTKKLSIHSKFVLITTICLILFGTVFMFLLEYNNPYTMKSIGFGDRLVNSFFASVSPRTAGFNSIPLDKMTTAGTFMTILLMFIGGSPGSTAGGIKTTTFGMMILTLISVVKGREDTEVFGRRFNKDIVYKSFAVSMIAIALVLIVTMILSITEHGQSFINLLFEATSAFATVGLTVGVTTELSFIGKIIIIITMYLGRVGPLTVALALGRKKRNTIRYPEGKILIG